nr:MAG TPA: hypothetical protein [Caudoviricetes sp.]
MNKECAYRMTIRCFNNIDGHVCSLGHKQYSRGGVLK